jgi:hypothetical protein
MSNGVRTAVVVVCGLFIGGLGASGMPVQAHAQGWVAVAADSKGRWGYAFGERTSARARAEALRGCGARGCDIQETARAPASPMWRAVRADIGMASASVARRTRPSPRPGADAGWARRLERAES